MVIRTSDGKVITIDHRERGPAAARPDSLFEAGQPLAFNDALRRAVGRRAGDVRGWEEALRRNGTMSMTGALGPAIRVARDGFVVDQTFVDQTQQNLDYFDDVPSTQALYLDPDGTPHDVGTVLRNPDLARTYERIARLGAKGFCRGAVADAMAEPCSTRRLPPTPTSSMCRSRGCCPTGSPPSAVRSSTRSTRPQVRFRPAATASWCQGGVPAQQRAD